jgi:hypothetical protein
LERLVYAEWHNDILATKQREMNIKHWRRAWKVALILRDNPKWGDCTIGFKFVGAHGSSPWAEGPRVEPGHGALT